MEIAIAVGLLILAALILLATIDMAFSQLSDISLRRLATDTDESSRPRAEAFLREILEQRPRFRFALSSGIQFLLISFTILVTIAVLNYTQDYLQVAAYSLLIGLVATVSFRQILPRLITRTDPERKLMLLLPMARPLYAIAALASSPFSSFFRSAKDQQKIDSSVSPNDGEDRSDDNSDDLQALMEVGAAEGIIEEKDRELIQSLIEFSDTRVEAIMTPRTEIVALPIDSTVKAARDMIIEEKYSRLPVYRESIDNIEGVIYVRDILQAWAGGHEDQMITEILRPAYFVPETKSAADLLKNMQVNHVQIAFVIDEYGGVAGVVTVEDILEEIVGEIEDEDIEEEEIIEIMESEGGYWDVLGSTDIGKIERLFDMEIEDDDFSTIAGLITSEAGYVPVTGEKLEIRGLAVEILKADEKRVYLVRLSYADPAGETSDAAILPEA